MLSHKNDDYPFSLGGLVESLQGAGVSTEQAIDFARDAEKYIRSQNSKTLKLDKLSSYLSKRLEEKISKTVADNFKTQTPPFVPIRIQEDVSQEDPNQAEATALLSRRLISKSLEKFSIKQKDISRLFAQLEQYLRSHGYEYVARQELHHLIARQIETLLGHELRIRYEQDNKLNDIKVISDSGEIFPFSHGVLARSLMSIGLEPALAYSFTEKLERNLWKRNSVVLSQIDLNAEIERLLSAEMGSSFAKRYGLMQAVHNARKPLMVLIGGSAGVGKSTLAYELAYRLGIQRVVSSDAVRQALRSLISEQLSPALHLSSFTAWQADVLPGESMKPKRKRVLRGFQSQVQQLSSALKGIVERSLFEGDSIIVEGAHLVPGAIDLDAIQDATVFELILVADDEQQHRNNFALRDEHTLQRRQKDRYLGHFTEIRMIQTYLQERAKEEGITVINTSEIDDITSHALALILNSILMQEENHSNTQSKVNLKITDAEESLIATTEAVELEIESAQPALLDKHGETAKQEA